jgi:HSP20 family protein
MRNQKRPARIIPIARTENLLFEGHDLLDRFTLGSWIPNVDICQTDKQVLLRVELPGVDPAEISLIFQEANLLVQGIKREPGQSHKFLCYYCLERRYGTFDRKIPIDGIVNPREARAFIKNGILTVELPKVKERRGAKIRIPVAPK